MKLLKTRPTALMIHVPDWEAGLAWYRRAFPDAQLISLPESDNIGVLRIGDFLIEVVSRDEKVSSGMVGTICYWEVDDLPIAIEHFRSLGSNVHRGPMLIEDGMGMCQVTDTFGNLIGLRGYFPVPAKKSM